MMRRSRISVRPNVRPVARGLTSSQESQSSNEIAAGPQEVVDITGTGGMEEKQHESTVPGESAEAEGQIYTQDRLNEKSYDESSGGSTLAATGQRRKRFSAMPNIAKPRLTVTPMCSSTRTLRSPPPTVAVALSCAETCATSEEKIERNTPQNLRSPSNRRTSTGGKQTKTQEKSARQEPALLEKKSNGKAVQCEQFSEVLKTSQNSIPINSQPLLPESSQSKQSSEVLKTSQSSLPINSQPSLPESSQSKQSSEVLKTSQSSLPINSQPPLPEPSQKHASLLQISSANVLPSSSAEPAKVASASSDRERIMKAHRLRELMKQEWRKEKKKGKPYIDGITASQDWTKMTMRDLIYYLPDTNPMTSYLMEEHAEKVTTPSPNKEPPQKPQEVEQDEVEDDADETANNDQLLVPKVKVAEDGSLIIDEESLTVAVSRNNGPAIVEENDPIFERGSTTTYSSFRRSHYTKPWSMRETDMFFLAISMVGTDFSMIGQLFTHRSRAEIKNKFKREERANAWRIDKAFREKQPFNQDFFSMLLERVLDADKNRKKLNTKGCKVTKKTRGKQKGKKTSAKRVNEDDVANTGEQGSDAAEDDPETAEKENEDCSNVGEVGEDGSTDKKRRKRRNKAKDEEPSLKKPADEKRKRSKKTRDKPVVYDDSDGDVANSQPAAEESTSSETAEGRGEPTPKSAHASRGHFQKPVPKLKGKKRTRESLEQVENSALTETGDGEESDSVFMVENEGKTKRGKSVVRSSDEEDLEEDPEVTAVQEQMLNRTTRSGRKPKVSLQLRQAEEDESAGPLPAFSPAPKEVSTKRQEKQRTGRPKPNLTAALKSGRVCKPKLVTLHASTPEEAEWEEGQPEEELCFLPNAEEQNRMPAFVPVGLRSPEPVPMEVEESLAEISVNLPDELGTREAASELNQCSQFEAQEEDACPTEHQLDLMNVVEASSLEHEEGAVGYEGHHYEAAGSLPICLSESCQFATMYNTGHVSAVNPACQSLLGEEPESHHVSKSADQSQRSCQLLICESAAQVAPKCLDLAVETTPSIEEPQEPGMEATPPCSGDSLDRALDSKSLVQRVGRRRQFPKPQPKLCQGTRISPTLPSQSNDSLSTVSQKALGEENYFENVTDDVPPEQSKRRSEDEQDLQQNDMASVADSLDGSAGSVSPVPQGRISRCPKPMVFIRQPTCTPSTHKAQSNNTLSNVTSSPAGPVDTTSQKSEEDKKDFETAVKQIGPGKRKEVAEQSIKQDDVARVEITRGADPSTQSVPQGRRSRFPKPKLNTGRSIRGPPTAPVQGSDLTDIKPIEEEKNVPADQTEKKVSDNQNVKQDDMPSAADSLEQTLDSHSLTQSVSQGRRRFPKPKPTIEQATRNSLAPATQSNNSVSDPKGTNPKEEKSPTAGTEVARTPQQGGSLHVEGDPYDDVATEAVDIGEQEPTFILTLFEIQPSEVTEYEAGDPGSPELFSPQAFEDSQLEELSTESAPLSCDSPSAAAAAAAAETRAENSGVTLLVFSDSLVPVSEGLEERTALNWTSCNDQKQDMDDLESSFESHISPTPATPPSPVVESNDLVDGEEDWTSGRVPPSSKKRKLPVKETVWSAKLGALPNSSMSKPTACKNDKPGNLGKETEMLRLAPTRPQSAQSTMVTTAFKHTSVAINVSAVGDSSEGTLSPLLMDKNTETREHGTDSGSGEALRSSHPTAPMASQGPLTRPGRKPRGFLSFMSNNAVPGSPGSQRPARTASQRPQVNNYRLGRKRSATVAATGPSDSCTIQLPPAKINASISVAGPSPKVECPEASVHSNLSRCLTPDVDEPTKVSRFFISDILTEVEEPDSI